MEEEGRRMRRRKEDLEEEEEEEEEERGGGEGGAVSELDRQDLRGTSGHPGSHQVPLGARRLTLQQSSMVMSTACAFSLTCVRCRQP